MRKQTLSYECYMRHIRNGMNDGQVCELYNIKPNTLKNYKSRWKVSQREAMERQFFLIMMRKSAGLSQYEMASQLGMRLYEYIDLEENPAGIQIDEKKWCLIEVNLRELVVKNIQTKRSKFRRKSYETNELISL